VQDQQKSASCPTGASTSPTTVFTAPAISTSPIVFTPGWADPPTISEVIHGKKLTVADELRIGQENVEKVHLRAKNQRPRAHLLNRM
jgi:hypothetical protein